MSCIGLDFLSPPVPEVFLKMFENKEQSEEEVAMAWEEEEKAEESALQKQEANTVDDDDTKVGGDNSEEDENRATRRSTFVSSFFQCFRPPHLWLTKNKIYFFMVQRECDTLDK